MEARKRVNVVSLKMVRESSILYHHRVISSPIKAVELIRHFTNESDREMMVVIALDTKCHPTAVEVCSVGDLNSAIVHPREVFKMSLLANAGSIILGHNHPSGDAHPSKDDDAITDRIESAGAIIGVGLMDHIIIGDKDYYSYKEDGRL